MNDIKKFLPNLGNSYDERKINELLDYWFTIYDKVYNVINYELLIFLEIHNQDNEQIINKIQKLKEKIAETYQDKQRLIKKVFSTNGYYDELIERTRPRNYEDIYTNFNRNSCR